MKKLKELFASLRVFKRIRVLDEQLTLAYRVASQQGARLNKLEDFIESREPCGTCGHHRYRQKTIHYDGCTRAQAEHCLSKGAPHAPGA